MALAVTESKGVLVVTSRPGLFTTVITLGLTLGLGTGCAYLVCGVVSGMLRSGAGATATQVFGGAIVLLLFGFFAVQFAGAFLSSMRLTRLTVDKRADLIGIQIRKPWSTTTDLVSLAKVHAIELERHSNDQWTTHLRVDDDRWEIATGLYSTKMEALVETLGETLDHVPVVPVSEFAVDDSGSTLTITLFHRGHSSKTSEIRIDRSARVLDRKGKPPIPFLDVVSVWLQSRRFEVYGGNYVVGLEVKGRPYKPYKDVMLVEGLNEDEMRSLARSLACAIAVGVEEREEEVTWGTW